MKNVLIILLLLSINDAYAFHINPSNRSITNGPDDKHFLDRISEPVHESLTRETIEEYWNTCGDTNPNESLCLQKPNHPKTINDSIIRGVWWADDPNQNLYKARHAEWLGNMLDAERRAKSGRYTIDQRYKMHYRSHYGDMQFLHAMAYKDGVDTEETRRKIYMWLEFLYQIATKKLGPESEFKGVNIDGFSDYFGRHQKNNWKLKWIFQPRYYLSRSDDFSEHALGVMLHLIQDSYSKAHVKRVFKETSQCKNGSIQSFYSYSHQSSSKHGAMDTWEGYTNSEFTKDSNPVSVGAKLIHFVKENSDWKADVLPYLDSTVFCLDENSKPSGPGAF